MHAARGAAGTLRARHLGPGVIGGGATGLGWRWTPPPAASGGAGGGARLRQGHLVARTKLVHGGVRYLAQGNIAPGARSPARAHDAAAQCAAPGPAAAVRDALVQAVGTPFYGAGLKVYDALAAGAGCAAPSSSAAARRWRCLQTARPHGLKGGVLYWDGQFDDARLALALARTAAARGALLLNYCRVTGLLHAGGRVPGGRAATWRPGASFDVRARVSSTPPASGSTSCASRTAATGRAGHGGAQPGRPLVVDRVFLPGEHALLLPETADGRVLFGVPWLGKLVWAPPTRRVATCRASRGRSGEEIDFILRRIGPLPGARAGPGYPQHLGACARWSSRRPDGEHDQALSREHTGWLGAAAWSPSPAVNGPPTAPWPRTSGECFEAGLLRVRRDATLTCGCGRAGAGRRRPVHGAPPGLHGTEPSREVAALPAPTAAGRRPHRGDGPLRRPP